MEVVSHHQGDEWGDFFNDFIVGLNDGSSWKVRGADSEKFANWEIQDPIVLRVYNAWYPFTRDHKFELYNAKRKESVRAMLLKFADHPLTIVKYETATRPVDVTYRYTNQYGGVLWVETVRELWKIREVTLSDNSKWAIYERALFSSFKEGDPVIMLPDDRYPYKYLSSGVGKDAYWTRLYTDKDKSVSWRRGNG